jgi:heat shock protein HtpX
MRTIFLTIMFPIFFVLLFVLGFGIEAIANGLTIGSNLFWISIYENAGMALLITLPIIAIWFVIAFSLHRQIIFKFAGAKAITRTAYPELFNIVENLCISR